MSLCSTSQKHVEDYLTIETMLSTKGQLASEVLNLVTVLAFPLPIAVLIKLQKSTAS